MKDVTSILLVFLMILFLFSLDCASGAAESKGEVSSASPPPANPDASNANAARVPPSESDKRDQEKLKRLDVENESFRTVPPEFTGIDFANFRFRNRSDIGYRQPSYVALRNGAFEHEDKPSGGTTFSLDDVFYVNLVERETKVAVVFIGGVACGGSCDGGSETIYFYSAKAKSPIFLAAIPTGSTAYGCSLRSFTIKDKKIYIEQNGRCNGGKDQNTDSSGKFLVRDITKTVYSFVGRRLRRESRKVEVTPEINVMNTGAEISINN